MNYNRREIVKSELFMAYRILLFFTILVAARQVCNAQYWLGPKGGLQLAQFVYLDPDYVDGDYKADPRIGYFGGFAGTYSASGRYFVQAELDYEYLRRKLEHDSADIPEVESTTRFSFVSLPVLMGVSFELFPLELYLNAGVKFSYWLSGKGSLRLREFHEVYGTTDPREYTFGFSKQKRGTDEKFILLEPNRLQYAFLVGSGLFFNLANGKRMVLDARYTFGHSNMGFNGSQNFAFSEYFENFEYRTNYLSVSLGYFLEYDANLKRKGGSTSKASSKTKRTSQKKSSAAQKKKTPKSRFSPDKNSRKKKKRR